MTGNGLAKEISLRIRAKEPILVVETFEEERVEKMLAGVAKDLDRELWSWTITGGLVRMDPTDLLADNPVAEPLEKKPGTTQPGTALDEVAKHHKAAIFVFKDFTMEHGPSAPSSWIEDPVTTRKIRDIHMVLSETRKTIVMTTPKAAIPLQLQKIITVLDMALISADELGEELDLALVRQQTARDELVNELEIKTEDNLVQAKALGDKGQIEAIEALIEGLKTNIAKHDELFPKLEKQVGETRGPLVRAGLGLTRGEYENVVSRCIAGGDLDVAVIIREKKQVIRKGGLLEFVDSAEDLASMGGNAILKRWMNGAKKRLTEEAAKFGLDRPKGLLLLGPPGTGKSLSAKIAGNVLQVPVLRLDMSMLASKWYGETASNISHALKMAAALAPVVLWIDEIEKALSVGGTGEGHEETMRTMATLLTFMEESRAGVFVVATCNNDTAIKPELMARFPKVFFVDLPGKADRKEIFAIHLAKVGRNPKDYDLEALAQETEEYAGREIRDIIQDALQEAFNQGVPLSTQHLKIARKNKVPGSKQKAVEIKAMRERLKDIAMNASEPDKEPAVKRVQGVEFA
jgi:MoxR-like ATPase